MIRLGAYNNLKPVRNTSVGVFLEDDEGTEILLPNKYVPEGLDFDETIEVFCYLDHSERPIATTLKPKIIRGSFAYLKVADVNNYGAFLDWGLEKHLLVPYKEQSTPMEVGKNYLVHCYLDELTFRLAASARLDKFLDSENIEFKVNQEVKLIPWRKTDLGWEMIIDQRHKGLLFNNDIFKKINRGEELDGFIKNVREDGKIDLSLQPLGVDVLAPTAEIILEKLKANDGFLPLNDKSKPERIQEIMGMSKKTFKKGVGVLYKNRKIEINDEGIRLKDVVNG